MLEMTFGDAKIGKIVTKIEIMLLCMLEMNFSRRENWKTCDKNRNNATMHDRNELFEARKLERIGHKLK